MSSTNEIVSSEAVNFLSQVTSLLDGLVAAEIKIESGYAKLGYMLSEVSEKGYWRASYDSFGDYIAELSTRFHRGRTQLYNYMSTVKELRPYLDETQLNNMGIAKAGELAKSVRQSGFPPDAETMEKIGAPSTTLKDVRKLLFESAEPNTDDRSWFDLGGISVSADERKVIESAFNAAWHTDPVVAQNLKESVRIKEAILRMSMEYLAGYQDLVEQGVA